MCTCMLGKHRVMRTFNVWSRKFSAKMGVNYGLNRVRFTAPVPAGSHVRGRVTLKEFIR